MWYLRSVDRRGSVTGIVLAGGRSTRFGRDKLLEPVDGEPLLWLPIRALAAVCDEVLVATATGRRYPLPPDLAVPVRLVEDEQPDAGPVEGLRVGLAVARQGVTLGVGGDMPSLDVDDLRRLVATVADGALAASFGQPLPCAVDTFAARQAIATSSRHSLRALLASLSGRQLPVGTQDSFRDIDAESDL